MPRRPESPKRRFQIETNAEIAVYPATRRLPARKRNGGIFIVIEYHEFQILIEWSSRDGMPVASPVDRCKHLAKQASLKKVNVALGADNPAQLHRGYSMPSP